MKPLLKNWAVSLVMIVCLTGAAFAGQNIDKVYKKTAQSGSKDRQYTVHLPTGYSGSTAYPLVMVLHGCKQTNKVIQHDTDFDRIADNEGFIVIYPFITTYDGMRNENCWGFWFDNEIHRDAGEVGDLYGIIQEVSSDYNVDANRIHITGLSSGGAMTTAAMVAYPDVFASGAPGAGIAYGETSSTVTFYVCSNPGTFEPTSQTVSEMDAEMSTRKRAVSALILHATDDCMVPIKAADNNRDAWLTAFGISSTPHTTDSGTTLGMPWTHKKYGTLDGRPSNVETFYVTIGGSENHGWVGGKSGAHSYPNGPDWSQVAWDFFKTHPMNANEAPTVTITSGSATGTCVDVSGTAADVDGSVSEVRVTLDGRMPQAEGIATGTTSWSYQKCNLPNNQRYVPNVVAIDDQGERSEVVIGAAISVGTPPANTAPSISNLTATVNEQCVTLSGTVTDDDAVSFVELNFDSQGWNPISLTGSSFSNTECGLAAATYYWDVRAGDNEGETTTEAGPNFVIEAPGYDEEISDTITNHQIAGRIPTADATYLDLFNTYGLSTAFTLYRVGTTWYHDRGNIPGGGGSSDTPPELTSDVTVSTDGNCATFTGSATDDNGVASVEIKIDGGSYATASLNGNDFGYNLCGLADGVHSSMVRVTDTKPQSIEVNGPSFTISTGGGNAAPTITVSSASGSDDGSGCISMAGSASDDTSVASIEVKIGSNAWQAAARNGDNWSFNQCGYANGDYALQARATDGPGLSTTVSGGTVTVSSGSFVCQDWYGTNYSHVLAGRAYDNFGYAYTVGADDLLGLDNIFYYSNVKETASGYFEIGTCP